MSEDQEIVGKLLAATKKFLSKVDAETEEADDLPNTDEIIASNCVGPEVPRIFRHFECRHLLGDIQNDRLTLIHPSEATQLDPLENPLGSDEFSAQYGELQVIMRDFYSLSWSTDDSINMPKTEDSIVLEVDPRNLMRAMLASSNRAASISYFLRGVVYRDEAEIRRVLADGTWEDVVESTAQRFFQSIERLDDGFEHEEEIRLTFMDTEPTSEQRKSDLYFHPLRWNSLVEEYKFHADNQDDWSTLKRLLEKNRSQTES